MPKRYAFAAILFRRKKGEKNGKRKKITCPVCGGEIESSFDICKTCGWEDDDYQEVEPDDTGANGFLTLNEAKKIWEASDKKDPKLLWKYMELGYSAFEHDQMTGRRKK